MSTVYKSGKKVTPKKTKELRTIDIHNAFVTDLQINLIEFLNGVRIIPEKQSPPKLKILLNQIQSDVFHFIDQYRMTQDACKDDGGFILKRGNKSFDEEYLVIQSLNKQYKKSHGASKFMPHKLLLKAMDALNKERLEKGESLLREIGIRTYDSWKKRIKSTPQ